MVDREAICLQQGCFTGVKYTLPSGIPDQAKQSGNVFQSQWEFIAIPDMGTYKMLGGNRT